MASHGRFHESGIGIGSLRRDDGGSATRRCGGRIQALNSRLVAPARWTQDLEPQATWTDRAQMEGPSLSRQGHRLPAPIAFPADGARTRFAGGGTLTWSGTKGLRLGTG